MCRTPKYWLFIWMFVFGVVSSAWARPGHPRAFSKDVFSGNEFSVWDSEDRQKLLTELRDVLRSNYVGWVLKSAILGESPEELFAKAIEGEAQLGVSELVLGDAESNLAFEDRVRALLARFQDGHLNLQVAQIRPVVHRGFEIRNIKGRYFVTRVQPVLLAVLAELSTAPDQVRLLLNGRPEVLAVDGKPVAAAVADLLPYVSGSSPGARQEEAEQLLWARSFFYPAKSHYTIRFRAEGMRNEISLKLPWFYQRGGAKRVDALTYLQKNGFVADDAGRIGGAAFELGDPVPGLSGLRRESRWTQLKDIQEFKNAAGEVILRSGYVLQQGRVAVLIQLMSFFQGKVARDQQGAVNLSDALGQVLSGAHEIGAPVIFDLRVNSGGHMGLAVGLMSTLLPAGRSVLLSGMSYGLTRPFRTQVESAAYSPIGASLDGFLVGVPETMALALRSSIAKKEKVLPWFSNSIVGRGAFTLPVVVLTGPRCMSACEHFVRWMHATKRATVMGEPTAGTGFGFSSLAGIEALPIWKDTTAMWGLSIPNLVVGEAMAQEGYALGEPSFVITAQTQTYENKPLVPPLAYSSTPQDLQDSDAGWLAWAWFSLQQAQQKSGVIGSSPGL